MQIPIGSEDNFKGMIDLVEMKALVWESDDKDAEWQTLEVTPDLAESLGRQDTHGALVASIESVALRPMTLTNTHRATQDWLFRIEWTAVPAAAPRELAATGERIRRRDVQPVVELTAQETQIARLVADGRSNPEIAAELFISPRTVEYHLHKIFSKLDITARGQLARALGTR